MATELLSWIGIIMVLIFSRTLTTLVHEMGHALPSLLFTSREVTIYVGSYGNIQDAWVAKIGRLTIVLRLKILELHLGLCSHHPTNSIVKELMIIFGGPLFSLLLGLVCLAAILDHPDNSFLTVTLTILLVSGVVDFFTNILPDKKPMQLHDGTIAYNDGYQLIRMLKMMRYPESYFKAMKLFEQKDVNGGVDQLIKSIDSGIRDLEIYKMVIYELMHSEQDQRALEFHEKWGSLFKLDAYDFQTIGDLCQKLNNPLKALQYYGLAIDKDYLNAKALFSRGKLFYELGYPEKAKEDLKKVTLMQEGNLEAAALFEKLKTTS